MKITIVSTATVEVPRADWPSVLRVLSAHHQTRLKSWAETFVTDTQRCPLQWMLWDYAPGFYRKPQFTMRAWNHLLAALPRLKGFKGELIFRMV